jgi:hypothetical protein
MPIGESNFKALADFAAVAQAYVDVIDSLGMGRPPDFYRRLEALLPQLHLAILAVRNEWPDQEHPELEALGMTDAQRAAVSRLVHGTIVAESDALVAWYEDAAGGNVESFEEDKTRACMLFTDLAETYDDLHRGLALWNEGSDAALREASFQWRYAYEIHWGEHLLRAMLTVHEIRYRLLMD